MIRLRDASTLALTKLRTRKIRLFVTIFVSGLLFSLLASASMVVRGAFSSVEDFGQEGFGSRYIISGYSQSYIGDLSQNETIVNRATALHNELIARKKAEAKRLNISYDAANEPAPVQEFDIGGGKQRTLDLANPSVLQAVHEYMETQKRPDFEMFQESAANYSARSFYQSLPVPMTGGQTFRVLKEGAESFDTNTVGQLGPPKGIDSFSQLWQASSKGLLEPFVLPGQTLDKSAAGEVPIIIPISAAEELLGMNSLSGAANPEQRLSRIKEVRERAPDIRFEVCVRNSTSNELVSQAISAQKEIEANKDKRDYVRPALVYGLPTEACGPVTIARDIRTSTEKRQAASQEEFDRTFGKLAPEQKKFAFRVVGVVADFPEGAFSSIRSIFQSILTSSLGTAWFTPDEYIQEQPELRAIFDISKDPYYTPTTYYAEFDNSTDAKNFMDNQNCLPDFSISAESGSEYADPYAKCLDEGKAFSLQPYGSNSLALESARNGFNRGFRYAAMIFAVIAAIIMMGTVGRTIADSRRETAVFRAIGAKRIDIAQIYVIYTVMLSLFIYLFAILTGLLIANYIHDRYSSELTVEALVAYNAQDLGKTFRLYVLHWPDIIQLVGLALAAGLVSSVLPLLRNLRRNPIRDMRDDT